MTDFFHGDDPRKSDRNKFMSGGLSPIRHLNQKELARRWSMSTKTLERWRWLGEGPTYLKLGGKILYRLEDVEAFEIKQTRKNMR